MQTRNEKRLITGFVALGLAGVARILCGYPQRNVDNEAEKARCHTTAVNNVIADLQNVDISLGRADRDKAHEDIKARYYGRRAFCREWFREPG
jgi:hypothetical protein